MSSDSASSRARGDKGATSGRRRAKASATGDKRERILRAAIEVFARKGFYDTRVSEIAKAAGVADGTIYLYFKNKEDVLVSIFDDRLSTLIEVLRGVAASGDPVEDQIRKIIELQLGLLEDQRDLAEVVTVNLRQSAKLLRQYGAPLFLEYLDVIAGVIAAGQRAGTFRKDVSPRTVARGLWGALDGIALGWVLGDADAAVLRKAAGQYASVFLDGLRHR